MVVNKRKKNTRMRAKTTHGYGSKKKHRGAGHRGGRGNAGSGKRGDAKKPSLLWKKGHKHKGKVGFKTYNKEKIITINLNNLDQKIEYFVKLGKAENKQNIYIVDFTKYKNANFNFNKLLGTGSIKNKYEIKIKYASEKAIKKIEGKGGKVVVTSNLSNDKLNKNSKENQEQKQERVEKENPLSVKTEEKKD